MSRFRQVTSGINTNIIYCVHSEKKKHIQEKTGNLRATD